MFRLCSLGELNILKLSTNRDLYKFDKPGENVDLILT